MDLGVFPFGAHTTLQVGWKRAQPLNYLVLAIHGNLISIC